MPKTEPFDTFFAEYEAWFENHPKIYEAELNALRELLPPFEKGVEIEKGIFQKNRLIRRYRRWGTDFGPSGPRGGPKMSKMVEILPKLRIG